MPTRANAQIPLLGALLEEGLAARLAAGAAARAAVAVEARAAGGALLRSAPNAAVAFARSPMVVRPQVQNYRAPIYYAPRYSYNPQYRAAFSFNYAPQIYNSYAAPGNYQPQARQCWTTGVETFAAYGGTITRTHYRCING